MVCLVIQRVAVSIFAGHILQDEEQTAEAVKS